MNKYGNNSIVLELNDIRYLLIPPEFDPFSENKVEFMGEAAFVRIIKKLEPGLVRRRQKMHLTIKLPPDQIKPGLEEDVDAAVKRFCLEKIEDNRMKLKNLRWNGIRAIPFSILFLGICLGLGRLLGGNVLTFIPEALQAIFSEGFTIIGWVSLWDPVETLLFDPIPIKRNNEILEYVMNINIDIQAQKSL